MSFRTNVYIDGFNFYYGCLKGKNHLKWLNFIQLSKLILGTNPNFSNSAINKVYFFTALVKNTQKKQRQNIYLEVLKKTKIEIIKGNFIRNEAEYPLVPNANEMILCEKCNQKNDKVKILKTEEKGTDVNLAAQLLIDAFEDKFDIAMVFSNDSDFLFPLKISKDKFKKNILLINPNHKFPSYTLKQNIGFFRMQIPTKLLKQSQFPETIRVNENRQVTRPKKWK